MRQDICSEKLKGLIADIIEVDASDVMPNTHLVKDLGADSMAALEIVATLEKTYGIVIEADEFPSLSCLADIQSMVERLTSVD